MKPTKETQAFVKALSVWDNFHHIGRELAVVLDDQQDQNFQELVEGYNTVKDITNGH